MQYLKYKKLNTTSQQRHPHIKRKVTSTQLGPTGKATHFFNIRGQRFTCEVQQSGVPPSFYGRMVETEPFSAKLCLIFCIFEHFIVDCIQKLSGLKVIISYIFTVWHFIECFIDILTVLYRGGLKWCNKFFCEKAFNYSVTYYTKIKVYVYDICQHNHISK